MRSGFILLNIAIVALGIAATPAKAAGNLDCAIDALEDSGETMMVGYENMLAFADQKQLYAKGYSNGDLDLEIAKCATDNGWSKAATALASQFTLASASIEHARVQMSIANAPEDFGKKLYNDTSAAELKILRKTGVLSKTHMALVASTLLKYFGAKPEKGVKEMLVRWPQMLEDRDLATEKFLKLAK